MLKINQKPELLHKQIAQRQNKKTKWAKLSKIIDQLYSKTVCKSLGNNNPGKIPKPINGHKKC